MKIMSTQIEINGIVVQIYESVYDYASRNASFSNYADEKVDVSYFSDKDEESKLPKVFVRPILLYKDLNFSVGKQLFDGIEFPEIIEIDGLEYILVNFGEYEISYLKADAMDKPVYTLIYRTMQVTDRMYLYVYPFTEIFETMEAAQVKAEELNKTWAI
ncbi:predicted protein [Methanosarcina acetivorans C2A]|uniref:Uncharacterized protein n=2 Tax=Methanosarcina acetivorans TaxID=2214 RepID=Q8TU96_METAC|nr:predicted protein [Methanosarcina acetivorans C2A]